MNLPDQPIDLAGRDVVAGKQNDPTGCRMQQQLTILDTEFGTAKVDCVRVREGKPKQAPVPEEAMPDEDPFDVEGGEEVENEPEAGWEE